MTAKVEFDSIKYVQKYGVFGWRKKCLFCIIFCLLLLIIINFTLVLWILKVMEFSTAGMGDIRVVRGGFQVKGSTVIEGNLIVTDIASRDNEPIVFDSFNNFTINTRKGEEIINSFVLERNKLECTSPSFQVKDSAGNMLFSADKNEVVVGADVLSVTGKGGAIFNGSVQTPLVRTDSRNELSIESFARSIEILGAIGVALESRAGDLIASCLLDLKLQSVEGTIQLDAAQLYLKGLQTAKPPGTGKHVVSRSEIYQLCVCGNGKLFLAPPDGQCIFETENNVCK